MTPGQTGREAGLWTDVFPPARLHVVKVPCPPKWHPQPETLCESWPSQPDPTDKYQLIDSALKDKVGSGGAHP